MYIDRPPRIQPELPFGEHDIPRPPAAEQSGLMQLIQLALPLITVIGFVAVAVMGGGQNVTMIVPMMLSVVAAIGFSAYMFRKEKQKLEAARRAYDDRLVELNKEMSGYHDQQRRFYRYNYPDLGVLLRVVQNARVEVVKEQRTLRGETRLWERRYDDEDFGVIRLGMGTLPSTVTYRAGEIETLEDPQARAAKKLEEDSRFVANIPVIIALRGPRKPKDGDKRPEDEQRVEADAARTPVTHALGIAGEPSGVYEFTRALVGHFTVFHAPMDARLFVLGTRRGPWEWVEQLPHCQGDEQTQYTCFVEDMDDTDVADEGTPLDRYLEGLRRTLATRRIRLADREETADKDDPTAPFLLVVVDLLDAVYDEKSPLRELESDAAMTLLLAEGSALGAAVIVLAPERSKVPSGCLAVVEIERTAPAGVEPRPQLHFRYAEVGVNSFRYVGRADAVESPAWIQNLAARIAELDVRRGFGASLANAVPFLDLMGYNTLVELEADAWQSWQQSATKEHADWMRVKIGRMAGNKPRTLIFSAKKDGVHGMVAGSTGSGKSELLISLITAMAVTYDPTVLNFVLVDFKGGGAFKDFANLPHCVDIITNLGADGVTRMFTAISAEMQRRQALNSATGTKNIVDYREKGLHLTGKPYPFLFIIIDEFAEMIAERPEYKAQLESITRVGRAQGVSLLLAAQRPSGVTDQMRSNIKFRICLRVETSGESREMLRRADAAFLPSIPGRGYLQVGNDEIELIQVAYTGDRYIDPAARASAAAVLWPDRRKSAEKGPDREPPELYKEIISRLDWLARRQGIERQRAPWPNFLPQQLALDTVLIARDPQIPALTAAQYITPEDLAQLHKLLPPGQDNRGGVLPLNPGVDLWSNGEPAWQEQLDWETQAMRPVVGLIDNPYMARQAPLYVDLPQGHAVLFGAAGWGKTTFLRTLAVSLMATHSPDQAHLYVLDLGGRSLSVLEKFPHVGAVIFPDEEGFVERVEQLMRELQNIVEKRKDILNNAGANDVYQYNKARSHRAVQPGTGAEQPLPCIVVLVDNFIVFKESFDKDDPNVESVLDKFVALAREAKNYGVHFVITADSLAVLPNQVLAIFTERLTLKLADAGDYRLITGAPVDDVSNTRGRGYVRGVYKGEPVGLSFQVAQPLDLYRPGATVRGEGGADAAGETGGAAADMEPANETKELGEISRHMYAYMAQMEALGRRYQGPVLVRSLPRSLLYKQLLARQLEVPLDAAFPGQLAQWAGQNWDNSQAPKLADWLRVTLGVIAGDRPRTMRFEAKHDGVHGLVAGGTGSGKSELLMTLIAGLALNYDPSILNFVLVDYKGGGAFEPFRRLPHCVEIVTNLNKSAVRRMFTAIGAEIQRRQKLNAETGTANIVDYRQQGLHLQMPDGTAGIPYPHLFIIIDEYGEMISDSPEYKAQLESITRVGRAQGVHLLLASQRPTGITDQMRENIKYRICLRVEAVDTSREMLRRSDAAFLPNNMPGRGYLQIGNDNIELIQVAYAGEEYEYGELREGGRRPRFLDVIVQLTDRMLTERVQKSEGRVQRPRTPWPPGLPNVITLSTVLPGGYMDPHDAKAITLGREVPASCLNPFVEPWFAGESGWQGVDWEHTALRGVAGLVDDPYNAKRAPLVVNLTRGHGVIFGASGWGKTAFIRSLIVSLAATHAPGELHVHVLDLGGRSLEPLKALPHVGTLILPDEQGYEERVQQLLRELRDEIDQRKLLFGAANVETLYQYNAKILAGPSGSEPAGSGQTGAGGEEGPAVKAAILVVVDNFAEFLETFGNDSAKEGDENNVLERFVALARQSKPFGVHFLITASRLNVISTKLYSLFTERFTLRLADAGDYSSIVGTNMPDIDELPGRGYVKIGRAALDFQVAMPGGRIDENGQLRGEIDQIRALGQKMREVGRWTGQKPLNIEALPTTSSYRQVLARKEVFQLWPEENFLETLKAAMAAKWVETARDANAAWLKVTLGIVSGDRPRTLHLAAKYDGVHGLVAGGTGSGKSELLMTLIIGLAANYDPSILNFVLVDYKGGGAFKPFERLPHCVDMVTNLGKAGVHRMFTAINAELRRRQKLNADTGTKDIVEYRSKNLHVTNAPYPHLFIIIDEYSEMIDENPDYRAQLESITRVGRAQGVNLLLASQRPKGVTDQMRANIKLRLCLRVEESDTSIELLRRPDAAYLPNGMPGRGYLQIGNDNAQLIQVSYTGEAQRDDRPPLAAWPDRPSRSVDGADEDAPKLYDAVVMLARELNGQQMAPKPWPAFLPEKVSLQAPIYNAQRNTCDTLMHEISDWLNGEPAALWPGVDWGGAAQTPIVGLVDDPGEARQFPLAIELGRNHLIVFGDSGWGKTTFLRTIAVSLAGTHSPSELHVYVLDLGGRSFTTLGALPHVGAVICSDDEDYEERMLRLLDRLEQMVEERQAKFGAAGVNSLREYNRQNPEVPLPAVLVLVDNITQWKEENELLLEAVITPLVRRSLNVGITFVVTANTNGELPAKVTNLFGDRVTFRQANAERYLDIVGRGAVPLDEIPGRGYVLREERPLQFQAALPVGLFGEGLAGGQAAGQGKEPPVDLLNEADELRRLAAQMRGRVAMGEYRLPASIDTLPAIVPLRPRLEATRGNFVGGGATRGKVRVSALLGEDASLQPAEFNLRRLGPHFVVTGPPLCGKTTTLYNFVLSVAARYSPEQVKFVLIDFQARFAHYGGANRLDQLPHVVASIVEAGELPGLVERLEGECKAIEADNGRRSLFVVIDNFDDLAEDTLNTRDNEVREAGNTLVRLARRYGTRGVHFLAAGAFAAPSDMGRILLASNFGIGLRTGAALDTLKVNRIPSSLRDRELGVGRGFIIKSGQATMIQVATPYQDQAVASTGSELDATGLGADEVRGDEARGDEEDAAVAALDAWIAQLREQWQEYTPATWAQLAEGGGGAAARTGATLVLSRQVVAMQDFLRKAMLRELRNEAGEAGNGAGHELLTQRWLMLSAEAQGDESVLLGLCRDAVVQKLRADGVPQPESMVQYASSAEDLLMMAEGFLGGEDEGGEESDEFALDDAEFADELEEMFGDDEEAAED